jgi:epoxyqueuosine reductase QueG
MTPAMHDSPDGWLNDWMEQQEIALWGAADLVDFQTPADETGAGFRYAVSFAIPVEPSIMVHVRNGPTHAYAGEYVRINKLINEIATRLAGEFVRRGYRALPLAASERTDKINIRGDFPQKTVATRAGLGWIGHHCQLVTSRFGSWVRLGTVFTDCTLNCGKPMERSFCGTCTACVEACPPQVISGTAWVAGIERDKLLDFRGCDNWKSNHFKEYLNGRACGICSAVCPHGLKTVKKSDDRKG